MTGETNLVKLLETLNPYLNKGDFVFSTVEEDEADRIKSSDILSKFKEREGTTIVVERVIADQFDFSYENVYSWITLKVHSSLEAVGLTAAFASELAKQSISCNVIAGYYHDHIFVNKADAPRAMQALSKLSERS